MSDFWTEFPAEETASGKQDSDGDPNPFDPFKPGPGKPSLKREYLRNQRDQIMCLIEPHWHELEWNLRSAKTPEGIHAAFRIDAFKTNPGPLAPLLQSNAEQATLKDLETTRKQRADGAELAHTLWNKYQEQRRLYEESRRVASQFSLEFEVQLRCDLARRNANITTLTEEAARLKQEIRERELEQKTRIKPTPEQLAELAALKKRKGLLEAQASDEGEACESTNSRLQAITADARKLANEEEAQQKSLLDSLEADWKRADAKQRKIDEMFQRREAFVFRKQVLDFIKAKEYTLTPRHVANAIAGLPYIRARRSAQRCMRIPCMIAKSQIYQLFEFVTHVWKQYRKRKSRKPLVGAFEHAIRARPKFKIIDHKKKPNWFRAYLAENWYYLKGVLDEDELAHMDTRAVPGEIVKRFVRQMHRPDSPLTPILAKRDQILD